MKNMKITRLIIYLLIFALTSSCAIIKAGKYFKEGKIVEENFKVTLPFEMKNGFIVVNVVIENKDYHFILDTGAPNVVSNELAESLNLKVMDSINVGDVFNESKFTDYTRIETIKIGTLSFIETNALIKDFSTIPIWSSMDIDGVIGSNLMRYAIWDFDFEQNQITITDNESKLNLPENVIENKLFVGFAGVPSIACKINGEKIWNFPVDFGYSGDIVIPFSEFKKQKENGQISNSTESNTGGAIGIYEKQDNNTVSYTGIINELEFGNSILKNQKVYSEQYLSHLFGLDFFRNYRAILNWDSKKIKLIENTNS